MNYPCYIQELIKTLQRSYIAESMDNGTDRIVANTNLEYVNNYNTWNHLTVRKQMSSLSFANDLHIVHVRLKICKQMTDVKLLLLHSNTRNHLTVCKKCLNVNRIILIR